MIKKEFWENRSLKNIVAEIDGVVYVERWVDLPSFEGLYQISTFGRIKSLPRMVYQSQFNRFAKRRARIIMQAIDRYGYCKVTLQVDKNRFYYVVHVLSAKTFIPNPKRKTQVNHKFGNKKDNFYLHLEWNTPRENSLHAISLGIDSVVGVHNGRCLLTEKQVLDIRSEYKGNVKGYREILSKKYGVSKSQISKIVSNRLWKHLNTN